jgi:hypothetical protein
MDADKAAGLPTFQGETEGLHYVLDLSLRAFYHPDKAKNSGMVELPP